MASPVKRESCGVSRELTDTIARDNWTVVKNILSESSRHVADSVVTHLINEDQWSAVRQIIECVEDEDRTWDIGGVLMKNTILLSVAERDWICLKESPSERFPDSTFQWIFRQVCTQATEREVLQFVLFCCADDRLDSVLTILVERRQWLAVGKVLVRGVSESIKQWAVREACKHCQNEDFQTFDFRNSFYYQRSERVRSNVEQFLIRDILHHCADDQLNSVLTTLVERHLWHAVGVILEKKGVSDSNKHWAVLKACTHCESYELESLIHNILHHCADDQLDSVLTTLVERHLWHPVGVILEKKGVSDSNKQWAVQEACTHSEGYELEYLIMNLLPRCLFSNLDSIMPNLVNQGELEAVHAMMRKFAKDMEAESYILPRWYVDVLQSFVEHHLWNYVKDILHSVVMNSLCHWVKRGGENRDDSVLWAMVNTNHVNVKDAAQFFKKVKEDITIHVHTLQTRLGLTKDLCNLLYTSLVHQVCVLLCSDGKLPEMVTGSIKSHINLVYNTFLVHLETSNSVDGIINQLNDPELETSGTLAVLNELCSSPSQLFLHVLQQINLYYVRRRGDADDEGFLILLSVLPVVPELQSVALRIMLRHRRWDVISQADRSGVWEQDRRHLLQEAVKQRQWSVVKRWADHTLYDDQRVWALNEALNEKQWDVALLLADHGLTDIDLMRVHYRLAKYADWDVILHMFERGADVAEVGERLGRMKDNKRIPENVIHCICDRCSKVRNLEKEIQIAKADALEPACRSCKWIFVLFTLIRNPGKQSVRCALKVAIQKKAWHVVMQLVRLGMDARQRHSLFSRMMKRRQWGVCRVLLEQGLSVQLCLKVLPHLMEINQWVLVARVMEHDVGDDVRQQVMQRAWERREGSVVWLCIKSLPTPLSVEEREALFQRAFICELWQVIKPLVEEKDETGIRHRDTALLEAIEQHQWDLVDHCQRHHADINMKDDDGHTPLQRAAMKKDWEAVEELVVRDGDPNLLDRDGYTVLYRVLQAKEWRIAKLLIEYQADIHKEQKSVNGDKGMTPLGLLIDARRMDIIDHTLLWCPDQSKGVNTIFETSLHVACVSGCYDSMYNLVARGVNPLAVTKKGQSVLVYAVLNEDRPQRMVAECIRLGFSTHQPKLTNFEADKNCFNAYDHHWTIMWHCKDRMTSPFLSAMLRRLPVVMEILYESGACTQRELFRLYKQFLKLTDQNTMEGRTLQETSTHDVFYIPLPYLTEIATTPRSLESTCRLVISHCLTLSKTRHRDVDQLPLTERMKNFVLFSDLTDPDFGKVTT